MPPESRGRMGLFRRLLDQRHAGSTPRWAETVSRCLTIDDLRQLMEHRVPPVVTDYFLGGAGSEQTMRDNVEAFARARFNPHYGVKHTVSLRSGKCGIVDSRRREVRRPGCLGRLR
jgi:hypothetical protein